MTQSTNSTVPKIRFKGFEGDWEAKTLGQIANVYQPQTISQRDLTEVGYDVYGANGIIGKYSKYNHEEPQIAVTCRGNTCGTVNFTKEKSWITGNAMVVNIDDNESVTKTFLFQQLSSQNLNYLITGSGQPQITGTIKSHRTWLCHPDEQTKIGGYFRELDRLIGLQQRKHDKLVTLKKAMLQKMFPQPGTNTPEIRFKGFKGDWVEKSLGEVATFLKGKGLPKSSLVPNGAEPCIHYGELFTRYPEIIGEIISRTNSSPDAFRSNVNDVLMPTSDVTPRGLAKASCLTVDGVILGGDILVIRSDVKRICGSFLSYVIRREEAQVLQFVTGSTVFHLYGSNMKNFMFSMPSVSEQTAIAAYFHTIDELISRHAVQLEKLKQIKSACLHKMFV
ncbi:MAG: restriction endonuclease subunit S [Pseudomonadota bacterium]